MVVIGLGKAGCAIATLLKKYKEYKVILLDEGKGIKRQATVEEYEENTPKFTKKLKFSESEVLFITCGASKIASCSLRVLEQIKDKNIHIVYVHPDANVESPQYMKRNRVVFNVLQQYTRSGVFKSMYLFDNRSISESLGETSILDYYNKINEMIANSIHTINYFNNTDPVFGSRSVSRDISRIKAISIGSLEKNEENLCFPLDNITETCYIYNVSSEELKNNSNVLTQIKERGNKDKEDSINSSFCIYESPHDVSYFYSVKYTHFIQKEIK